jgi:chromosome segregation ATPase
MQEDAINIYCLSHGLSFPTLGSNRLVICTENHVLSYNFPHSGRWFYCCLCQKYWVAPKGEAEDAYSKQCPSCNLIKKARYYSCDQCNVTMIDSIGAINRKEAHITPWGTPHPHCPGCHQLPKTIPQSHACPELNGLLTTARAQCPFCEGKERAEGEVDREGSGNDSEIWRIESSNGAPEPDTSYLELEELERKASAIRALEAEAQAREAKAQARLRQVETRLREEMSRRSELERKSQEIEQELKRQPEIDQTHIEIVRATSEAAARFEEERNARVAAEQAKAEAEAKLREMEVRASETEERLRQSEAKLQQSEGRFQQSETKLQKSEERFRQSETKLQKSEERFRQSETKLQKSEERFRQSEAGLQQEVSKRTSAEERANELETRFAAESAKIKTDAEAKIQAIGAERRRIEEKYKVEIDWIRGELETTVASVNQAQENHKTEITRITFEAESRVYQAEANARQYQIKVEEAIASAQAAMFNLEETQKKLDEAQARYQEMEIRVRQAETRAHRLYLISKLTFTSAEDVISETHNAGDDNGKDVNVIPLNGATTAPLDSPPVAISEFIGNDSLDYGEYPFTERMKALFQAAARANATEDKSGAAGGDGLKMASGE